MIMDMCKGDVTQYTSIMNGTVESFLIKFEHYTDELRRAKKEAETIREGNKKWRR